MPCETCDDEINVIRQKRRFHNPIPTILTKPALTKQLFRGIENDILRGLTVQLLVFHGKDRENILTWLLQVDLLFKARKIKDEEKLLNIITDWPSFADRIKAAFQPPHHQQLLKRQLQDLKQNSTVQEYTSRFKNLLGQIKEMHEVDKVIYFTEGVKGAMKAKVNCRAPDTLDDAVNLLQALT
ncbi:27073_t:CDS:2 [Dentiscutata erythropus]|uniref:27073_t:CDS:1 n=1 Tax=Dentiscutata erythropus TaxID=1348616 RepID=A0A9N9A343_9GLOM|nr:27073_t:CDS:2 [Dentiscutata erythropus]